MNDSETGIPAFTAYFVCLRNTADDTIEYLSGPYTELEYARYQALRSHPAVGKTAFLMRAESRPPIKFETRLQSLEEQVSMLRSHLVV